MCIFGKVLTLIFIFVTPTNSKTICLKNYNFPESRRISDHLTSKYRSNNQDQADYKINNDNNVTTAGAAHELFAKEYLNHTEKPSLKTSENLEETNAEFKPLEDSKLATVSLDTRNKFEEKDVRKCSEFDSLSNATKHSCESSLHRKSPEIFSATEGTDFTQNVSDIDDTTITLYLKDDIEDELPIKPNDKNENFMPDQKPVNGLYHDRNDTNRSKKLDFPFGNTSLPFNSNDTSGLNPSTEVTHAHHDTTDYSDNETSTPPIDNTSPTSKNRPDARDISSTTPLESTTALATNTYQPNPSEAPYYYTNHDKTHYSDNETPLHPKDDYTKNLSNSRDVRPTSPPKPRTGFSSYQTDYVPLYQHTKPSDHHKFTLQLPYKTTYHSLANPYFNTYYKYEPTSAQPYHNSDSPHRDNVPFFPPRLEIDVSPLVDLISRLCPALERYHYPPKPPHRTYVAPYFPRPPYLPPDLPHPHYPPYERYQSYDPGHPQPLYDQYPPYDPRQAPKLPYDPYQSYDPISPPRPYEPHPPQPPYEPYPPYDNYHPPQPHDDKYPPYDPQPRYDQYPPYDPYQPPYQPYPPFDPLHPPQPTYEPYPSFEPPQPSYETYPPFDPPTEPSVDLYPRTIEPIQPYTTPDVQQTPQQLDSLETYDSSKPHVPSQKSFNPVKPGDISRPDQHSPPDTTQPPPQSRPPESEETQEPTREDTSHMITQPTIPPSEQTTVPVQSDQVPNEDNPSIKLESSSQPELSSISHLTVLPIDSVHFLHPTTVSEPTTQPQLSSTSLLSSTSPIPTSSTPLIPTSASSSPPQTAPPPPPEYYYQFYSDET